MSEPYQPDTLCAHFKDKTVRVPRKYSPLWWQVKGLSYTTSGYGRRIPTSYMVQLPGSPRWRRVYCCQYSNAGTCYVDGPSRTSADWIVITD